MVICFLFSYFSRPWESSVNIMENKGAYFAAVSDFLAHLSRRLRGELLVYQSLRRPSVVRPSTFSNIFLSETTGPIKLKFHMETPLDAGTKVCSNGPVYLALKAPPIICSRGQFQILLLSQKYQIRHDISWESSASRWFSWNIISYFFWKSDKMLQNLSSASVVIGALRVCFSGTMLQVS